MKVGKQSPSRFAEVPFIVDIGSDLTMIPARVANKYDIAGYNSNLALAAMDTSFSGKLEGRFGSVLIQIGEKQTSLDCFYYDVSSSAKTVLQRLKRYLPGREPDYGPIVLGRSGFLEAHTLIIENGWVAISDRSVLSL